MSNIGIIGWGVVGQAVGKGFAQNKDNQVLWYDKFKKSSPSLEKVINHSEFIFLCLPTPVFKDYSGIDLSAVTEMITQIAPILSHSDKILIIKSTVIPGTTASYANKYPHVNFAMNPEFLTEINAPWDFLNPDRVIIGSFNEAIANRIAILHRSILNHDVKIFITDPTTAELVKYMSNTYLATKIIFANEMHALAQKLDVNYDEVVKMVTADPRIEAACLSVTPFGGFGLKCFPKDTVALLGLAKKQKVDLSLLKAVWQKNLKLRKVRDWETIDGAVSPNKHAQRKTSKV